MSGIVGQQVITNQVLKSRKQAMTSQTTKLRIIKSLLKVNRTAPIRIFIRWFYKESWELTYYSLSISPIQSFRWRESFRQLPI